MGTMRWSMVWAAAVVMSVPAVAFEFSGRVVGFDSVPLAGVSAGMECLSLSDTTGADGLFVLSDDTRIAGRHTRWAPQAGRAESARIWYDLQGRTVASDCACLRDAGARGVRFVQAEATTRAAPVGPTAALLSDAACTGDTVVTFSGEGYVSQTVTVDGNGSTGVTVVMHVAGQHDIPVAEAYRLYQMLSQDPGFTVIDIRTPSEFASGHIPGAINIDYYAADFATQLDALPKGRVYLVHCRSGSRSGSSMPTFDALGFQVYYNMLGGMNAWTGAGYPVE